MNLKRLAAHIEAFDEIGKQDPPRVMPARAVWREWARDWKEVLTALQDLEGEDGCSCALIMACDKTRHFRGCPLREKYPSHDAEKGADALKAAHQTAAIYKAALVKIVGLADVSDDFDDAYAIACKALSPQTPEDKAEGEEWLKPLQGVAAAVGPLLFNEQLAEYRECMEKDANTYTGQHASGEVARVRQAVQFLLAVAHQPVPQDFVPVDAVRERFDVIERALKVIDIASINALFRRIETLEHYNTAPYDLRKQVAMLDERTAFQSKCDANNVDAIQQLRDRIEVLEAARGVQAENSALAVENALKMQERIEKLEKRRLSVAEIQLIARTAVPFHHDEPTAAERADARGRDARPVRRITPTIVCLCGSTRFSQAFADANLRETLVGKIVLTVGSMTHSDAHISVCNKCGRVEGADARRGDFCKTAAPGQDNAHEFHPLDSKHHIGTKGKLDTLHLRKIEIADEVLVLNVIACRYCKRTKEQWQNAPKGEHACFGRTTDFQTHDMTPYIGESTRGEIAHALAHGKPIRFLNDQMIDMTLWDQIKPASFVGGPIGRIPAGAPWTVDL